MDENILNEGFLRFQKSGFFRETKQVLKENWDEEEISKMKELVASGDVDNIRMVEQMLSPTIFEQLIEVEYGELLNFAKIGARDTEAVSELLNIDTLDLRFNNLTSIPENIGRLKNMQVLRLGGNQITYLPESIGELYNLRGLGLYENALESLPESIGQLTNLRDMGLWDNELTSLPEGIGQLANLSILNLMGNQLTALPKSISQLQSLKFLRLMRNDFSEEEKQKIQNIFPFAQF